MQGATVRTGVEGLHPELGLPLYPLPGHNHTRPSNAQAGEEVTAHEQARSRVSTRVPGKHA